MVYSNKFVVCVIVNGKVQKEKKNNVVTLPFNCEYAIRLRNKNDFRCSADIYLDGECVSGEGYVIEANGYSDIKRHINKDRAFKFVSLDSEDAVDHGKNGDNEDGEKGVIEVRFRREEERVQEIVKYVPIPKPYPVPYYPTAPYYPRPYERWCGGGTTTGMGQQPLTTNDSADAEMQMYGSCDSNSMSESLTPRNREINTKAFHQNRGRKFNTSSMSTKVSYQAPKEEIEDGCTVEGSKTGQKFNTVHFIPEGPATILKIFLKGFEDEDALLSTMPKKKRKKRKKKSEVQELREELRLLKEELKNKATP